MSIKPHEMTGEELLKLPMGQGERYELVEGELRIMSPAGGAHGEVASEIGHQIHSYVRLNKLGKTFAAETGFYLQRNPDTVRAPDVAFLAKDRVPPQGLPEGFVPVVPDLVVEVVSPYDTAAEVEDKTAAWLKAGVKVVWVVYPSSHRVLVHTAPDAIQVFLEDDLLDGGEILPGFQTPVRSLFEFD